MPDRRERHSLAVRTLVFKNALTREVASDGMLEARRQVRPGSAPSGSMFRPVL